MKDVRKTNILVVDDEPHICDVIAEALSSDQYNLTVLTDFHQALAHIEQHTVDLVLTDLIIGDFSGEQIVDVTLSLHPDAVVILMTAHPTVTTAISVLKRGAFDFLVKPFKLEVLRATVIRGLEHQRLARENVNLRGQVGFLKVASALQSGGNIDNMLRLVVRSCKAELTARSVGLIEIDPDSQHSLRKIGEADEPEWIERVLDEGTVLEFAYTKSTRPLVRTEEVTQDGVRYVETYISQPIFVRRSLHGVINVFVRSRFDDLTPGQFDILTVLTNAAAAAIANHHLYRELKASYMQAIRGLANAIEARDRCTRGHTDRVTRLAELVARHLGWDETRIDHLRMGCSLHDIGKIAIPDSVLNKTGRLTEAERKLMVEHPLIGLRIIEGIDLFKPAIPYILAHHERYDGTGYPSGLASEEIPIEGRLLAAVDAFDAIMATRPYREGADIRSAISELVANKGTQFDPQIVDAVVEALQSGEIDFKRMYGLAEETEQVRPVNSTETEPV